IRSLTRAPVGAYARAGHGGGRGGVMPGRIGHTSNFLASVGSACMKPLVAVESTGLNARQTRMTRLRNVGYAKEPFLTPDDVTGVRCPFPSPAIITCLFISFGRPLVQLGICHRVEVRRLLFGQRLIGMAQRDAD